ncbi:MAG TPA: hypothetical protein VH092_38190 [Urbifossiella sp.]|jgi:hypothetical protein|nr:hypothetical protein [Urbifossiella sp.]
MPEVTILFVIAAGIVLWWCFLLWVIGGLGGWRRLARHYPLREPFSGRLHRFQRLQLGWSNYGGCVTIGTNADGLYLATILPFRPGHPAMFIPWAEVAAAEFVRKWYGSWLELRFAAAPRLCLRLPERVGRVVAAGANQSWAAEGGRVE